MGATIFAINVSQLWVFERADFVAMYAFRLVYYLGLHVGWGLMAVEMTA